MPKRAFHPCNLDLESYINNLASETSFYLRSRIYPWVTDILPETSQSRWRSLKSHGLGRIHQRSECHIVRQTLCSHLGPLGRILEHSSLHLKSHYSLILLRLLPSGVHAYTPCCLSLIGVPAHPSSHRPHLPWCTYWHLLSIWTACHSSREASTPGSTHPSPRAVEPASNHWSAPCVWE